jgi:hypothetical protein
MDTFTVEIPGVKPITLKAYFTRNHINLGGKRKSGSETGQDVTTCIIRKGNLTLGTGVAIQHPDDSFNHEIGNREAFKAAAQDAGWKFINLFCYTDKRKVFHDLGACNDTWKLLFSAWRKARRIEAEKVTE